MTEKIWGEKPTVGEDIFGVNMSYDPDEMDDWLAKLKTHYAPIEKQAETLRFLFGDEGIKTENLTKIQIWREKAERWDQYAIYDNDKKAEIPVKDLITAYEKLKAIRNYLDELEGTGNFIDKQKITEILEAEGR